MAMADIEGYDIDLVTLQTMYEQYLRGASKSSLEREYLDKPESHGKVFSSLVRKYLGVETEKRSALANENERLRRLLRRLGVVDPSRLESTHPTDTGPVLSDHFNFYGYVDSPSGDFFAVARHVTDDIVRLIETNGGRCSLTIEVRGLLPGTDEEVIGKLRASLFDLGFLAFELP